MTLYAYTATDEEYYNVQTVDKLCMLCNDFSPHTVLSTVGVTAVTTSDQPLLLTATEYHCQMRAGPPIVCHSPILPYYLSPKFQIPHTVQEVLN